jgi:hypothetical protein
MEIESAIELRAPELIEEAKAELRAMIEQHNRRMYGATPVLERRPAYKQAAALRKALEALRAGRKPTDDLPASVAAALGHRCPQWLRDLHA